MQIVDDEHQRGPRRGVRQQGDDGLEQEVLTAFLVRRARRRTAESGQEARQLRAHRLRQFRYVGAVPRLQQPPQRVGPGRIRNALDAAAASDERVTGSGRELLEHPGLPDPHFAADQCQSAGRRATHLGERGNEAFDRVVPTDEVRGPLPATHHLFPQRRPPFPLVRRRMTAKRSTVCALCELSG